ncbi:MAG TPA: hypothetical protein VKU00_26215 [Chthonomonadaceae bacterium]|nr:hypothetical protein [Chthonomonadaceae bacterium]
MPDPIRMLTDWPGMRGRRVVPAALSGQIVRQDPLQMAIRQIGRYELRCWFEPDWAAARYLAQRFPHCLICSIPVESNTINLHRVPGWRPRPDNGVV